MAVGTSALSASFLLFHPVNVFMAFAFGHAVEYMIFVWAFQRRRYRRPLAHDPLLGRALRHPWMAYGLFTLVSGGVYLGLSFWGRLIAPGHAPLALGDVPLERWAFYWSLYQSMVHFYYDGFLWKVRQPALRASL